jgi:hypothetical protein
MHETNIFRALADQVRQGEPGAAERLRGDLEPRLVLIVARALRAQGTALPLTGWIQAQAQQVLRLVGRRSGEDPAWLSSQVARQVCQWIVERLRAGTCSPQVLETLCG